MTSKGPFQPKASNESVNSKVNRKDKYNSWAGYLQVSGSSHLLRSGKCCPGCSWDRVNFLPGSWCSALFWIWDSNNVDNILTFLVVARQSRIFQLLTLAWPARCSETGTQLGHLTRPVPGNIPYHMTSCSVYKLGGVGQGAAITAQG